MEQTACMERFYSLKFLHKLNNLNELTSFLIFYSQFDIDFYYWEYVLAVYYLDNYKIWISGCASQNLHVEVLVHPTLSAALDHYCGLFWNTSIWFEKDKQKFS